MRIYNVALFPFKILADTKFLPLLCMLALIASASAQKTQGTSAVVPSNAAFSEQYGKLPLSFEANQGQTDPQVHFLSRGNGYSLFLTSREAVLALRTPDGLNKAKTGDGLCGKSDNRGAEKIKIDTVRMQLENASKGLRVSGEDELPSRVNYFIGSDPKKWHSNMPTYSKVRYAGVYPGVDLVYYGNQQQLEYDFVIAPKANPEAIKLHFAGARKLELERNGDLRVIAADGEIVFRKPVIYQEDGGNRKPVQGSFRLMAAETVTFEVGGYDHAKALVIDPTLSYSTFLGGSNGGNYGTAIAVDSSGNAYVTGVVYATDFPTSSGAYQTSNKTAQTFTFDAFVSKLNSTGTVLLYSTYLGGDGVIPLDEDLNHGDYPTSIAVDSSGDAYVAGIAYSANFPITTGAYQTTNLGNPNSVPNCFITKLNPGGTALTYSTYLGGSGNSQYVYNAEPSIGSASGGDGCAGIAIDGSGNAYVTGSTFSTDFPVAGPYQSSNKSAASGRQTGFVSKLNPAGTALVYSTYLGGSDGDGGSGIALDATGDAYITGATASTDFPVTSGVYQNSNKAAANGYTNAFVTKINGSGSSLDYSTYFGGSGNKGGPSNNNNGDTALSIAVDSSGEAYVFGVTLSLDFPVTTGAYQSTNHSSLGGSNFFAAKFNSTGSGLIYSTYLGGGTAEINAGSSGMAVDSAGDMYITGYTLDTDYPVTADALSSQNQCASHNLTNAVFSELNPSGSELLYSTYFGGSGYETQVTVFGTTITNYTCDLGYGVALDSKGGAYLTGQGGSPNFPITTDVYQPTKSTASNAYISKFLVGTGTTVGPPASISSVSGSGQSTVYGSAFANPLVVIVKDSNGNAVSGAAVAFSGTGLSFSSNTVTTGSNGEASVTATAVAAGSLTATASTSGVTSDADLPLTATKAALTVTATNASVAYNQAIPPLTYTTSGFVNGDTTSVLSGSPTETTTATKGSASGTYPINISQGTLAASNYTFSFVAGTLTITSAGTTATPGFSPPAGNYNSAQSVTISDSTAGAVIYCTTNGTTPTTASTVCSGPIAVAGSETLEAIAVAPGYSTSAVASAMYTIASTPVAVTPTFSPAAGTYTSVQSISISDSTSGAVIHYTSDGSTPNANSPAYTTPISVSATETIQAIAVASGYSNSAVASAAYTINLPPPSFTLSASPTSATIKSGQSASITVTVTPQNSFSQAVSFSCSGLPTGYGCSFSPSTLTPAGTAVTTTLSIGSSGSSALLLRAPWKMMGGGLALALLLLPFRRGIRYRITVILFCAIAFTIAGCGSGSSPKQYSVTVTAAGGNITQTTPLSLTVTQ